MSESGEIGKAVFKFFYDYRLKWYYRGYKTHIVDKIAFKKLRHLVGGRVRIIACGGELQKWTCWFCRIQLHTVFLMSTYFFKGAPLCAETHEFIRNTLCAPLVQGYGLTETAACSTISMRK